MEKRARPMISLVLTAVAFVCFLLAYLALVWVSIVPHPGKGLLFVIPSVVFGILTILAWRGKISVLLADIVSGVLTPVFLIGAFYLFFYICLGDPITENPAYYSRIFRLSGIDDTRAAEIFPDQIPENATNVRFYYQPQILQGGEVFALSFTADAETIQAYEILLSEKSMWYGDAAEQPDNVQNMAYPDYFEQKGFYSGMYYKEGFTLYVLFGLYGVNTPNHADTCYAWLNPHTGEMVLCYEQW